MVTTGEKKVTGRKRHITVDTEGFLLKVLVHPADMSDKEGGMTLLDSTLPAFPTLLKLWADRAYLGLVEWAQNQHGVGVEVVNQQEQQVGFVVLPRRWVVERTFAWFGLNRQLSKDYHFEAKYSQSTIYLASIRLLLKRLDNSQ